jgi:EAL domain-containing protein (putative c-di-GMP-specific phosphodiesterase class I)
VRLLGATADFPGVTMQGAGAIPPARGPVLTAAPNAEAEPALRDPHPTAQDDRRLQHAALRGVLADGGPRVVYQPQLSLSRLTVEGYEALARFPEAPLRGTETWFTRARDLGLGDELEAAAVARALTRFTERPEGTTLAVNLSPGVLSSPLVQAVLPADLSGIEIELTEHEWLPGAARLRRRLEGLRDRGARLAIDDVGTAHSGLRRVMDLAPDRIKLDRALVHGVSTSTAKAALIRAVVDFAEHIRASVCAEGVETVDDLEALADLDVGYAQGWVIGLPSSGFPDADPVAVAAGRDSLSAMLAGRRSTRHDANADVDRLLRQLTSVTTPIALASLVAGCAGVLGGDDVSVGVVAGDGVRSLTGGAVLALDVSPLTRRCLRTRSVVPVYGDSPEVGGFSAALLVPVISRDQPIGVLRVYRGCPTPWSRRQITSAATVAALLGPVLDLLLRT